MGEFADHRYWRLVLWILFFNNCALREAVALVEVLNLLHELCHYGGLVDFSNLFPVQSVVFQKLLQVVLNWHISIEQ